MDICLMRKGFQTYHFWNFPAFTKVTISQKLYHAEEWRWWYWIGWWIAVHTNLHLTFSWFWYIRHFLNGVRQSHLSMYRERNLKPQNRCQNVVFRYNYLNCITFYLYLIKNSRHFVLSTHLKDSFRQNVLFSQLKLMSKSNF